MKEKQDRERALLFKTFREDFRGASDRKSLHDKGRRPREAGIFCPRPVKPGLTAFLSDFWLIMVWSAFFHSCRSVMFRPERLSGARTSQACS